MSRGPSHQRQLFFWGKNTPISRGNADSLIRILNSVVQVSYSLTPQTTRPRAEGGKDGCKGGGRVNNCLFQFLEKAQKGLIHAAVRTHFVKDFSFIFRILPKVLIHGGFGEPSPVRNCELILNETKHAVGVRRCQDMHPMENSR